jgi:hypothetical protein
VVAGTKGILAMGRKKYGVGEVGRERQRVNLWVPCFKKNNKWTLLLKSKEEFQEVE